MDNETLTRIANKLQQVITEKFAPFGAEGHEFQLLPCLTAAELAALEESHSIKLPDGYRQFLLQIGNGPVGPAYGLFPLEEALQQIEKPLGMLPLCHEGCGYYHLLALNEPTSNQMFLDGRVADGEIFPLECEFLTWYERWLDSVMAGQDGTWWLVEL